MHCSLWVIPEAVFPFDEDGDEDAIYRICEHCGQRCDDYKDGVLSISTDGADDRMPHKERRTDQIGSWSLIGHSFIELNEMTNGLLQEVVGYYQEGRFIRLFHKREELRQLRVIAEGMDAGHFRSFLIILVDFAEEALRKHGKEAVIVNW